ncbi:phage tail tape measure protein [Campylobacter sp. faydin G-24]|uniref:Phage tail tape measure protein n=1 Tax=Campylobacter anatolicus TaxID=2829105 RepID=A0ABS5HK80_9BACT|nr:phage tail tape measure protein [Campylobacter anatolicus]MBR8464646.1 phage tail tape measure protein [Campylobacter anatolicus]
MAAINRQSKDLSQSLQNTIPQAIKAYKKGAIELKDSIKKAVSTKLELDMSKAKEQIANLKGEIIAAVGSVAVLSAPIKSAMDFESAMADVKKVVDFDSTEELKAFSNELIKMSTTIPMSAEGLTQISAAGAQMGISKNELMKFTDLAAKTAVAFDVTAQMAGDSIGKIKNILSLSIDETGELMDAINHLSNKNAAKAKEIVEVMKEVSGIGKQVGITKEQTAALATSFIALGKTPQTAASASEALLKTLNNITSATPTAREAFAKLGIDTNDLANAMEKDAQGTIIKFLEILKKVKPQKRGAMLTAIMGKNYDTDIATLISGIDVYKNALNEISDISKFKGSNEAEFKSRAETTANSMQMLKNSLNAISINIGNVFIPYVDKALKAITNITNGVSIWVTNNESVVKAIGAIIVSLVSLKTAFLGSKIASAAASFSLNSYRQILTKLPFECLQLNASVSGCEISYRRLNKQLIINLTHLRRAIFSKATYKNAMLGIGSVLKSSVLNSFNALNGAIMLFIKNRSYKPIKFYK